MLFAITCLHTVLRVSNTPTPLIAQASDDRRVSVVEQFGQIGHREDVAQVSLVHLQHDAQSAQIVALLPQVVPQIEVAVDVLVQPRYLAVGHENDPVCALQH